MLDGDLAELLVYDRLLDDSERERVEAYLSAKHDPHRQVGLPRRRGGEGKPLVKVADPPPVQMLLPGFAVRQLPVELTNVNNLLYRADGKLVALAYDGNVYLLSDSDGDGLEDRVERFWNNEGRLRSPIGMALTPPGYKHGNGLFVASKAKCSLIVDTDGDDRADREIIVADGWQEIPHGVDALGVAFDERDGSIYFGLGSASFTAPYQIDAAGKSQYKLTSERATILARLARLFPSAKSSPPAFAFPWPFASIATAICSAPTRKAPPGWPTAILSTSCCTCSVAGITAFRPGTPKHLPEVIDEPSVCDYGPQHQSTCGLNFNEPVNTNAGSKGPVFGLDAWRGDALVCGYSRGKLYRTQLASTAASYVSRNQSIAVLNQLTCDACVSPRGELVVCVHSGSPDWGSGPAGQGKLFKIAYSDPALPQPVLVWQQSPQELHIAFDRPVPAELLGQLGSHISIEYGKYVAAGDRFESLAPGYQVVQDQRERPASSCRFFPRA